MFVDSSITDPFSILWLGVHYWGSVGKTTGEGKTRYRGDPRFGQRERDPGVNGGVKNIEYDGPVVSKIIFHNNNQKSLEY